MANHAFLCPHKMPTRDEIDAVVRRFTADRFPMLTVDDMTDADRGWLVHHMEDDYFGLTFWPSTFAQCDEGNNLIKSHQVIEFRHGHAWDALWWIEEQYLDALAAAFPGTYADSGTMTSDDPETWEVPTPASATSYREYLEQRFRWPDGNGEGARVTRDVLIAELERRLQDHRSGLPKSLRSLFI